MFDLHCETTAGKPVVLRYDPHASTLLNPDGTPVILPSGGAIGEPWPEAVRISPETPGRKSNAPSVLKIQLGLNCNYACAYCNQAGHADEATTTRSADADAFLQQLDRWLQGAPRRIEFWGGEPFLYFAKLRRLVPELSRRFPEAEFLIISNGSLLTREIVEFILDYDIVIGISHDGPGQAIRGADPFADPARRALIEELWRERKARRRMSFNAVLTPGNCDPAAIRAWFAAALGDPDVNVTIENVVTAHDEKTRTGEGFWTDAQYASLRAAVAASFESGVALTVPSIVAKAREFVDTLAQQRPSRALGQGCSMDREDYLAVDLAANVLTCQNTGGQSEHNAGSALDMQAVRVRTSKHWSHRESCRHCPVLRLCQGSCMYLHDDAFAQTCENEYQYNLGILDGILRRVCGLRLVSIGGDIRRPRRKGRTIPIRAVREAAVA